MVPCKRIGPTAVYAIKLVNAGFSGIHRGQGVLRGPALSALVRDSAQDSVRRAPVGALVGVLYSYLMHRRHRLANAITFGGLSFCAGIAWKTRTVSISLAWSALKEMNRVRDEHWLEMNPIDYAWPKTGAHGLCYEL